MSLRKWMLRALRAENRARRAERRAAVAETLAAAAMKKLPDEKLLELRRELDKNDD